MGELYAKNLHQKRKLDKWLTFVVKAVYNRATMEKKLFGLREATTALGILPQNGSNWLSALGLTNGEGNTRRLQLDRIDCVYLLVCQRFSSLGLLNFTDGEITGLLRYIIAADPDLEADLRMAKVATSMNGAARAVVLSSSNVDVLLRHQPPFRGSVEWMMDAVATAQLCYSTFSLGVLYEQVDGMFMEPSELAELKDPWSKFGVTSKAN